MIYFWEITNFYILSCYILLSIFIYLATLLSLYFICYNCIPAGFSLKQISRSFSLSFFLPPSLDHPLPDTIDKKRCSFRRETWRLSCSDVWVIRHEQSNNLDATRNLGALTWRRLNYGRSRPAIRYVTYLPATIDYAENTRLSPPRSARTRLDFRLDRGENLRALLGYLYDRQSRDFLVRSKTNQRPISHQDLLHSLRRTLRTCTRHLYLDLF